MSKAVDYGDPPPDVPDDAGDDDAGYGCVGPCTRTSLMLMMHSQSLCVGNFELEFLSSPATSLKCLWMHGRGWSCQGPLFAASTVTPVMCLSFPVSGSGARILMRGSLTCFQSIHLLPHECNCTMSSGSNAIQWTLDRSVDDFLTDRQLKHGNGSGPAAVDTHARRTPAVALQQSSAAVSSSTNTHARTRPPSDVSAQRQRTDVSGSRGVNHSQTTTGDRTHAHDRDVASHGHQHGQAPVASPGARPMAFDWGGFEQVASLQATNQRLLTELDAARQELADARRDADGGASDAMPISAAAASARVSALSKRNRELTASLGAERARLKTAQKEVCYIAVVT